MTDLSSSLRASRRHVGLGLSLAAAFTLGLASTTMVDWFGSSADAPAPGAKLDITATAYCKGTTTASGIDVRRGVAAADPSVLPVGSVVSVSTGVPEFDGVYTVLDTGPRVKGRALDLYVWSCNDALDFGRRQAEATVLRLGWDPGASAESLVNRLFRRVGQRAARRVQSKEGAPVPEEAPRPPEADASAHQVPGDEAVLPNGEPVTTAPVPTGAIPTGPIPTGPVPTGPVPPSPAVTPAGPDATPP